MLGYVKPEKPELKIKEYELYKGYYCSLCKALGKKYGPFSRLFLSYDVTFFVLFLYALKPDLKIDFKNGRCPFNPLKKCTYTSVDTDEFDFATAFSVIMIYYKVIDNIHDSSSFKKIKYLFVLPFICFKYKKAKKLHPEIDDIIKESITEQSKIEADLCDISDKAAHPSATALAECFALYSNEENKDILYRFGYCLGRYVYLIDAFDDLNKDIKQKNYNVFLLNGYNEKQIIESIRMSINEMIICLDLIDFYNNKSIIENIIKNGLDFQLNAIIKKKEGTGIE